MRLDANIINQTLQDLDGDDWGEPTYPSHLVTEYHRLRKVPLGLLEVEDLRLLIGQTQISENSFIYLIPLALEHLERNPWAEGAFYEGDLLHTVLSVPASFWHEHPELTAVLHTLVEEAPLNAPDLEPDELEEFVRTSQFLRSKN